MPGTFVRTYMSAGEFNRDARRLSGKGWTVAETMERRPRQGCVRLLLGGFLFPPRPQIVVTYISRDT